jgi:hypothetical protein
MKLGNILWLALIIGIPGLMSFVLSILPHKIVVWQGRFYRWIYKDVRGMTDGDLDAMFQLPTDRFFMGKRSDFIANAPHIPEKYVHLIRAYRIIGLVIFIFWMAAIGLLLLAIAKGELTI